MRAEPPTYEKPWSLVLYTDGVTPGDPLTPLNNRKFQTCYFSFVELGSNALSMEEAWWTVLCEFETVISKVSAGLSQIFAAIVKLFFNPDRFDMSIAGILLLFAAGALRLWCRLKMVLQDGAAHKAVWHARGDGATRPCFLCKNLVTEASGVVEEDHTNLLKTNVTKCEDLKASDGAEIRSRAR